MSSQLYPWMPAVKANNGVTNCNHYNDVEKADTLAITRGEYNGEWWGVDLEKTTNVKRVVVYGRTDDAPEQTHQYVIRVGDSPDPAQNAQCAGIHDGSKTVTCNLSGRYVHLIRRAAGHLALCEVEVFDW
mmetsp:Transcript_23022/g.17466  ORF Transcript_23022/g.17466 Transcript_23022/m.17466 type:complete len:130 (-) Transcript_23022:35-424(-)